VLRSEGTVRQYEVLLEAIEGAAESAEREQDSLRQREASDRARFASQEAKVQVYTEQLELTRNELAQLEGFQTEGQ
jgi:uncharacterized protein involved in exopolysaccharide biosynthesis